MTGCVAQLSEKNYVESLIDLFPPFSKVHISRYFVAHFCLWHTKEDLAALE